MNSLGTSRVAMESLSRKSLGNQQDTCEVSRKTHRTSRIALKSLGRVLGTSRIAAKSLGRVWGPAG